MAILTNNFEGGTNGTAITVANSGGASGNAFSQVTPSIEYSSAYAAHGSLSAAIVNPDTNYRTFNWAVTDSNVFARMYFYFDGSVSSGVLMTLNTSAGSPAHLSVMGDFGNKLQLYSGGDRGTTTEGIAPDTWYRAEVYRTATTIRWALYEGDATTAIYQSPEATGVDLGAMNQVVFGKNNSNDELTTLRYIDSVGVKTGSDAVWQPWPYASSLLEDLVWTGSQWR